MDFWDMLLTTDLQPTLGRIQCYFRVVHPSMEER